MASHACDPAVQNVELELPSPPTTRRGQFGNPTGWLGWVVGHAMAFKNRRRSEWALEHLELTETSRVLEIGFGSGADLARVIDRAPHATHAGIDPSETMMRMAFQRVGGNVELHRGTAHVLPWNDASFDRVFSINSVQFWNDLVIGACEVLRVLTPGGLAALAIEPRNEGATFATSMDWAQRLDTTLKLVGFASTETFVLHERDVPTVLVVGRAR
ncbi:MAG: class I SAM-dependent methyltransferase [Archangium sp.]